ncbi:hypothetical protein TWF970_008865 [Orbilia oligospora]|uniref:Uncharacterized protein n=1 Tax=Orbilia oligospora TaxID=2813651 RepID=A0A7C8VJ90_ORBOL|nr:hypothetical protein TWF970_008865 [Orbilia oligospora]
MSHCSENFIKPDPGSSGSGLSNGFRWSSFSDEPDMDIASEDLELRAEKTNRDIGGEPGGVEDSTAVL